MMLGKLNLKVFIYDPDLYGRYAINSYLAWDRRTRVVGMAEHIEEIFEWLAEHAEAEWPDILVVDSYSFASPQDLGTFLKRLLRVVPDLFVAMMLRRVDLAMACMALESGARACYVRNDVGLQIAWALVWAQKHEFSVSQHFQDAIESSDNVCLRGVSVLPEKRDYPELTDRIREAIQLCVVEGMSADLAADEMGVSTHTIRSYVKEGYRILESYDTDMEYPPEMSAQERAFMRYTAIENDTEEDLAAHNPEGDEGDEA